MPAPAPTPFMRTFEQAPSYHQQEPGDAQFNWLLKQDEVPGLCIGRVRLNGPIHKTPATHTTFDQVYLILSGQGTIHLADQSHPITGPCVIVIPRNTLHSVELKQGQSLEYAFINQSH